MMNLVKEVESSGLQNPDTPGQAYLMRILFESFRHAQGSLEVQLQILRNVASRHPNWRLSEEQKVLMKKSFSGRMTRFFNPKENPPLHQKVKDPEGQDAIEGMQKRFNEDRNPVFFNINIFTGHLVARDYIFIVENKRRPRGSKKINERNSVLDPYLSYVCYFGIEGNTTGITEFDDLYAEVKEAIFKKPDLSIPQLRGRDWEKVVEKYVLTHPSKRPFYEGLGLVKPATRLNNAMDRAKRMYLQML